MFHVFHWLIVELAILILCVWIFYYEVREFLYGRRRFWIERLVVQTIRMICCAIFSLVSFGPISRCRTVEGASTPFNMCSYFSDVGIAEERLVLRQAEAQRIARDREYYSIGKVGDFFIDETVNMSMFGIAGIVMVIFHAFLAIYWKNRNPEDAKRSPWYALWYGDEEGNVFGRRASCR